MGTIPSIFYIVYLFQGRISVGRAAASSDFPENKQLKGEAWLIDDLRCCKISLAVLLNYRYA